MPGQEQDDWLGALGIDVDKVRQTISGAVGSGSPGFDPSLDPSQLDAAARDAKAFVKGAVAQTQEFWTAHL